MDKSFFEPLHALRFVRHHKSPGNKLFHVGNGPAPHQVRLRVVFFSQHAGAQFAGGKTDDIDFKIRQLLSGQFEILDRFIRFEGGINGHLLRSRCANCQTHGHDHNNAQQT